MAQFKDSLLLVDKVSKPLQKIQENIRKTTEKASKMQEKFNKLNANMQALAPTSMKVLGATAKLTRAFIGLVGASGALTMGIKATAAYGDRVDKMSQKIGMGQKAFQEWDYIMSQNGGNVETLQMGFKTLTTQIEGVQKGSKDSIRAFADLGVAVKDSSGRFRNQDDIFNDTIRKLQKIQNPTKKAMLANRLFGRSATELRPLLNQEAEAIDNLRKKANRLGLILSEEDVKNAVEFTDTMDTLGRFFQARINKALVQILPKLSKIFNDLMEMKEPITNIIKFIGKIVELTLDLSLKFLKNKDAIYACAAALTYFATIQAWSQISANIKLLQAGFLGLQTSFNAGNLVTKFGLWTAAIWGAVQALRAAWELIKLIGAKMDKGKLSASSFNIDDRTLAYWSDERKRLGAKEFNKKYDRSIQKEVNNYDKRVTNNTTNNTTNNNYYAGANPKTARLTPA